MKDLLFFRFTIHLFVSLMIFCCCILFSSKIYAQNGHKKTFPDSTHYWNHQVTGGFSIAGEDNSNGLYLYGLQATYTKNLSPKRGLTVDLGIDSRNKNDTKIIKIIALLGATYWIKKADYSDPFVFSVHGLAGVSNVRYNYTNTFGSFKSNKSYFTIGAGFETGYYFTDKIGAGLRADALPTVGKNNTSINIRGSLNIMLRLGRNKPHVQ